MGDVRRKAVPDFLLAVQLTGKAVHRTDQRIDFDDVRFLRWLFRIVAFSDFSCETAHRKDRHAQLSGDPDREEKR